MSIDLLEDIEGVVVTVQLTGKLTKEDYDNFVPHIEQLIKRHGKIRMLVHMYDFHGWTASALWQDMKFDLKHFRDVERLALVGEKAWEHGMAVFCKPFTTATIRYFDRGVADQANAWIQADLPISAASSGQAR